MFQLTQNRLHILIVVAALSVDAAGWVGGPSDDAVRTYTVPTSIASNCTGGQTDELNAWLASIPSGTESAPVTVDFGASSNCYMLDDIATTTGTEYNALRINDKAYWELKGTATFKRSSPVNAGQNRALLAITRGRHVTSKAAMTFVGNRLKSNYDPHVEHDHNVVILGGDHIYLSGFTAESASGDNVYVSPIGDNIPHAITIKDATLSDASRHNVAVIGTTGMTLDGNTLTNNGYWSIDAELSHGGWPMKNLVISNNTARGQRYGFLALTSRSDAAAQGGPGIDMVTVAGNKVTSPGVTNHEFVSINSSAAADAPTNNVTIANNSFNVHQFGISAKYVSNLRVTGNQGATDGRSVSGVDCSGKLALVSGGPGLDGVTISNNHFRSANLWRSATDWCLKAGSSPVAKNVTRTDNISIPSLLFPPAIFQLLMR